MKKMMEGKESLLSILQIQLAPLKPFSSDKSRSCSAVPIFAEYQRESKTWKYVRHNMSNLCRCGTYVRIRKAVHRAAELVKGDES